MYAGRQVPSRISPALAAAKIGGSGWIVAMPLAARAASQGIEFSLEDLFEHDTVAALAAAASCWACTGSSNGCCS